MTSELDDWGNWGNWVFVLDFIASVCRAIKGIPTIGDLRFLV